MSSPSISTPKHVTVFVILIADILLFFFIIQVLSDSPAKVKWFRNKKQITEETDKYRFDEEGDSHSLLVTDAVLRDSGMYEATAENSRGITKIVGKLLVKCKRIQMFVSYESF